MTKNQIQCDCGTMHSTVNGALDCESCDVLIERGERTYSARCTRRGWTFKRDYYGMLRVVSYGDNPRAEGDQSINAEQ